MDASELIALLSRWAHVGTAIVLLGGAVFQRSVLLPSARALSEADQQLLRERILMRWKKFVMGGIALLLVSGFYNYFQRMEPNLPSRYHMWMGIKILLALGVFFVASALTGRSAGLAAIRQNSSRWLGVLIALSAAVVAIAGYLKVAYPAVAR